MSNLPEAFAAMTAAAVKSALRIGVVAAGVGIAISSFASTAAADTDDPEYFRVNMKPGASLNVRQNPSLKARKVGSLPAKAQGIVNLGCHVGMPYLEWRESTTAIRKVETRRKWCNIEYNGMTGWTAGQYLEADRPE